MIGGPGGGGSGSDKGQDPKFYIFRYIISSLVALVMSVILITLYSVIPQHEPGLKTRGPARAKVQNGVWEKNDFMGLIDTQWTLRGGVAEGEALQYHANGSVFRELTYRNGLLDGVVREYYEKPRHRSIPARGRIASPAERRAASGALRRTVTYRGGVADGSYEVFYPDGVLKEEGSYRDGRKQTAAKYGKDGALLGASTAKDKEENIWALGR
ncbi:MAG: hypothetical protein KBD07_02135 [Candidatus Omnitrophica bacterium]|nr:hypothetical protein [Candidatus Omnitrophota bacterium]